MKRNAVILLTGLLLMMSACGTGSVLKEKVSELPGTDAAQAQSAAGTSSDVPQAAPVEPTGQAEADSAAAAASAAEEELQEDPAIYTAYLSELRAHRDMILAYDWQLKSVSDYGEESNWNRTPVAIADITGDAAPELIYVTGQQNTAGDFGVYATKLIIDTWQNGQLRTVYNDTWDVQAGGGFYYCLFRETTGNSLYAYTSTGDESWTEAYTVFAEAGDQLVRDEVLRCVEGPDPNDYNNRYSEYYREEQPVSRTEYQSSLDALHDGVSEIVMFSGASDAALAQRFDADGSLSMSYADAEQYLLSKGAEGGASVGTGADGADSGAASAQIFADLPDTFWFASGVGAWSTDLTIFADGTFAGTYHDSNMGDIGTGYPNGTIEVCDFTGRFTDVQQVSQYSYSMRLAELGYANPVGYEWYEDGVRYHCADAYGLVDGETFMLYLPGAVAAELPQEFLEWVSMPRAWSAVPAALPCYGIYNVNTQCGFSGEKDTAAAADPGTTSGDGQLLPKSSERLLTDAEVAGLTSDQIQLAINEIYARHGYQFKKEEIRRYFMQYDWYNPTEDDMDRVSASFSEIEKQNVALLQGYR